MQLTKQCLLTALPVAVLLFAGGFLLASAQPFTYQGRLLDSALSAVGNYDLMFQLFDSPTNGNVLGRAITNSLVVSNGLFTAQLDFGDNLWLGETTWLEISVRPSGTALDFTLLAPRQVVSPTPWALFASAANASGIAGTISDTNLSANIPRLDADAVFSGAVTFSNPSNVFAGAFAGDGSALSNVVASSVAGSVATTNPVISGTVHYAPDITRIDHYVTNNFPNAPTLGLIRRSLNPASDAWQQTNWCSILRSAVWLSGDYAQAVEPTGWPSDMPTEFVFGTDASSFVIYLRGSQSYMGIEVDGAGNYSRILTPADGNFHFYTVQFASAKRREIALKLGNYQFGGIYLSPTNGLWPGIRPKQHRMIVIGDSFSEDSACTSWPSYLMGLFDNLDVWASAVGSTGYLNPGTPGRTNFQSRITTDVIPFNPEYVLFAGGINDASLMSNQVAQANLQQVCLGCYQLIQSNVPGCKVVALGPFWPRTPIDPAAYMVNGAVSNACQLAGISGCHIDTLSNPWVSGQWNIPGSGNAVVFTSSDGTHPTSAGAWNLAAHVAAELSSRFPELLPHR